VDKIALAMLLVGVLLFSLPIVAMFTSGGTPREDRFISSYLGYVYGDDPFNVTLYWCPSSGEHSRIVVRVPELGVWQDFNASALESGPYGYLTLAITLRPPGDVELSGIPVEIEVIGDSRRVFELSLGNWTFDAGSARGPEVIGVTRGVFYFGDGIARVSYVSQIRNTLSSTISLENFSYRIPGVRTLAVSCYNVSSPLEIPDTMDGGVECTLAPGDSLFLVAHLEVQPWVRAFFLRPRMVILTENGSVSIPGSPFEFVNPPGPCG